MECTRNKIYSSLSKLRDSVKSGSEEVKSDFNTLVEYFSFQELPGAKMIGSIKLANEYVSKFKILDSRKLFSTTELLNIKFDEMKPNLRTKLQSIQGKYLLKYSTDSPLRLLNARIVIEPTMIDNIQISKVRLNGITPLLIKSVDEFNGFTGVLIFDSESDINNFLK